MQRRTATRIKDARPPTENEMLSFFRKLPSRPLLIARTGQTWSDSEQAILCKMICPFPPDHAFVTKWNTPNSTLKAEILEQLSVNNINWVAIDCVGKYLSPPFTDTSSPTLLITVPPASTDWDSGVKAVHACKLLLEDFHFKNIEVEMKEGTVLKRSPYNTTYIDSCEANQLLLAAKTGLLGLPIGAKGKAAQGTLGAHLSLLDADKKPVRLALTCRHVFFRGDDTHEHQHGRDEEVVAVSASEAKIQEAIKERSEYIKEKQDDVSKLRISLDAKYTVEGRSIPENEQDHLDLHNEILQKAQRTEIQLKEILEDNERLSELGHVLYSPPIEKVPSPSGHEQNWHPD